MGYDGIILATRDGGNTWVTQQSNRGSGPTSIYFVNASKGWVVGSDGSILATQNGGQTWALQRSEPSDLLLAIDFVNTSMGWAVGTEGTIPESSLVALSAINHVGPELMNKLSSIHFTGGSSFQIEPGVRIEESQFKSIGAVAREMYEAIRDHTKRFGHWPPSEEDRERLEKLSAGIRIN